MTKFFSLVNELDGCFGKPLANLTVTQRARVEQDFAPWKWEGMNANERRRIAATWDFQNDQATAADRQRIQKHCDDLATAEAERDYWQSRADISATDAAIKQDRLTPILKRLDELTAEHKVMRGDDANAPKTPAKPPAEKETTKERRARWLRWKEEAISLSGEYGVVERVTAREKALNPKADRSDIGKGIKLAEKEKMEQKRAGFWGIN